MAALGGLDAIIFTAGIGEHAAVIREKIAGSVAWLGVEIDEQINNAVETHESKERGVCLSPDGAKVTAWMIPTDEDLMIAQHTKRLLIRLTPS